MNAGSYIETIRTELFGNMKLKENIGKKYTGILSVFASSHSSRNEHFSRKLKEIRDFQTMIYMSNQNSMNMLSNLIDRTRNRYSLNNIILDTLKQISLTLGVSIEITFVIGQRTRLIKFGSAQETLKFQLDQNSNLSNISDYFNNKSLPSGLSKDEIITSSYAIIPKFDYLKYQTSYKLKQFIDAYISNYFNDIIITKCEKSIILKNLPYIKECLLCNTLNEKMVPCRKCKFLYCQPCLDHKINNGSKECDLCSAYIIIRTEPKGNPSIKPSTSEKFKIFEIASNRCSQCPQVDQEISICNACGSFNMNLFTANVCPHCNLFLVGLEKSMCDFCERCQASPSN